MAFGKTNDEFDNLALVQTFNDKKVEVGVVSAKRLAVLQEAIAKASIARVLEAEKEAASANSEAILQQLRRNFATAQENLREQYDNECELIKRTAATKEEREEKLHTALVEFRKQRYKLEDELSEAEKAARKKATDEAVAYDKKIAKQKEEDIKRAQALAIAVAKKQYEQSNIFDRQHFQQRAAQALEAHLTELSQLQSRNAVEQEQLTAELAEFDERAVANKKELAALEEEEEKSAEVTAEIARRKALAEEYAKNIEIATKRQTELEEERKNLAGAVVSTEQQHKDALAESEKLQEAILKVQTDYYSKQTRGASAFYEQTVNQISELDKQLDDLHAQIQVGIETGAAKDEIKKLQQQEVNLTAKRDGLQAFADATKDNAAREKLTKTLEKLNNTSAKDALKEENARRQERAAEKRLEARNRVEDFKESLDSSSETSVAKKEEFNADMMNNVLDTVSNSLSALGDKLNGFTQKIDTTMDTFYEYQSSIEARLQGSETSYTSALKSISKNVGLSGLVKQSEVVKNLKELSDSGIAYNLELRAFLATIKDDIAQTFDAFDANLLRIIRLQQSDSTAARMGMEASLNRLFNEYFSDSSYLTDAFDDVSRALLEANSQLTKDASVEFEYMVQKWLGALYSVGMDSSTVSTIAQGLNYLGTGNVEALNGNESLMNLLAMSATNAGMSIGDILNGGLDAETTNTLMKSMVEYLQSIAENTDNTQVTKSAYSNVFGFNISDLTAVSSLSSSDIENLYSDSLTYQGAMSEYSTRANQIATNTHASQILDTIFENAIMSAATTIGNNSAIYGTWKTLNLVEDLTGGIAIPAISVMGNMVDLHQTVTGLAKAGIAGLSLMGSVTSALFSGNGLGASFDVNKWGYNEYTSRGSATKGISKGTASGFSSSSSFSMGAGSSSSSDMKSSTLSDATDSADEDAKITNKNAEKNADIYEQIYAAIGNDNTSVLSEIITLNTVLDERTSEIIAGINTTNELLREERWFKAKISGMDALTQLMDPNRVFYSTIVSMMPLTENSFSYNTDTSMLSVESSAILSSFAEARKTTTSYATDIMESIETTANSLSSNATSAMNSITSAASYLSGSSYVSSSSSTNTTENGLKQSTKTIAKLESALTSTDVQNISNLMAQTSVGIKESNDKTTNQLITNDGLKVSINQMSPEVSAYFAATIRSMVASAINGGVTSMDAETGDVKTLEDIIKSAVSNKTMDVRVTNDYFDAAMEKAAFAQ